MQINNINSTNFNAIYRLPNTAKNAAELKTHVYPAYAHLRHQPAISVVGSNPFAMGVDMMKEIIAKKNNCSKIWLEMNAQNHGLDLDSVKTDCMYVFSGEQEIKNLLNWMENRLSAKISKEKSIFTKLKNFFNPKEEEIPENLPTHLIPLFEMLKANKEEDALFAQYIKNIVNVRNSQELLQKMLMEK